MDDEDDGDEEDEDEKIRVAWDLDSFNDDVSDTSEQHKHNTHNNDTFWDFILDSSFHFLTKILSFAPTLNLNFLPLFVLTYN